MLDKPIELRCAYCKKPKAAFLFSPAEVKRPSPRCMACIKDRNRDYRHSHGHQLGREMWRRNMKTHFAK